MWIWASLAAAAAYAARYVIIKRSLSECSTLTITFATRFFGSLFLLWLPFASDLSIPSPGLFWSVTAATVALTGIASSMQFHAIRKYEISASLPFLSFVPLFMVVFVFLLFGEAPRPASLAGIVLLAAGSFVINRPAGGAGGFIRALRANRGGTLFLAASVILGLTTTLDRLAINDSDAGGLAYAFYWNALSAAVFFAIFSASAGREKRVREISGNLAAFTAQGFFGIIAFAAQMLAVEYAKAVAANVVYVKALTMLQLLAGVAYGSGFLGEKDPAARLAGTALMAAGAAAVIIFR